MSNVTAQPSESYPIDEAELLATDPGAIRRSKAISVICVLIGVAILLLFGLNTESGQDSTWVLTARGADIEVPDLVFPTLPVIIALGALAIAAGVYGLVRGDPRRANLVLALVLVLFVVALLAWATRGDSTNVVGLLNGTIRRSIPIALGALAGALCERSGVINIAIEGMLLIGAFTASIVASAAGSLHAGVAAGIAIGAFLGFVLAGLSIKYKVNQIVGGTVINLFALGMTSYLAASVLVDYPDLNRPGTVSPIDIPLLADIPIIGPLLFANTIYVYAMFVLMFGAAYLLFRTRWGLRVRSVGEHPRAADTVGINVLRTRYRSVVLGGMVAGFAGTFFSLDAVGGFTQNMTAGRGFIALAALIFGRYHPVGALGAALVFGFAEEFQDRLALLDTPIPSEFLLMGPYLVTLIVVAGLVGRVRVPAADGDVYEAD